jgi:hypothetical protein
MALPHAVKTSGFEPRYVSSHHFIPQVLNTNRSVQLYASTWYHQALKPVSRAVKNRTWFEGVQKALKRHSVTVRFCVESARPMRFIAKYNGIFDNVLTKYIYLAHMCALSHQGRKYS